MYDLAYKAVSNPVSYLIKDEKMTLEESLVLAFILPMFGLLVMTVMPKDWQNVQGWLLVSYVGIPAFAVILAVLINVPGLLFGALFVAGILAMNR